MKTTVEAFLGYMIAKGYIVKYDNGKLSIAAEPPMDEDPQVRAFWLKMNQEQTLRRFRKVMEE